ncbi:hypothetical protein AB9P05_02500 [Roseivirga sp. BDSF3-8]|uniref:hypothetical protein n=1 Tax=Roseivirga sp. BDSF3-8 TaxID=3241598 RepID=UPI003531C5EE
MLSYIKTLHTVREKDSYTISVNPLLNRIYVSFKQYLHNPGTAMEFDRDMEIAFSEVISDCTIVVDRREANWPLAKNDPFRFSLITKSLTYSIKALAEVVDADQYIPDLLNNRLCFPFDPIFKKVTSLHAAETWLNTLKITPFKGELFHKEA